MPQTPFVVHRLPVSIELRPQTAIRFHDCRSKPCGLDIQRRQLYKPVTAIPDRLIQTQQLLSGKLKHILFHENSSPQSVDRAKPLWQNPVSSDR